MSASDELQSELEKCVDLYDGVGAAIVVYDNGKLILSACCGERRVRSGTPTTLADKWHIGSVSKSFTATLIAKLIDDGLLDWNSTIGDTITSVSNVHAQWQRVTLKQLLTHTSGAPANFSVWQHLKKPKSLEDRMQARVKAAATVLYKNLRTQPGLMFNYSNVGYTLAGLMAEEVTGTPWETLMQQKVFDPLGLNTAGFGPPQETNNPLAQPRGHYRLLGRRFSSLNDNTFTIGPAGLIHMDLHDLCKYGNDHLLGLTGAGALLSSTGYTHLHQPMLANYACGWMVEQKTEIDGAIHWHNGSNTLWYTVLALLPAQNQVIAAAFNDGFSIEQKMASVEQLMIHAAQLT